MKKLAGAGISALLIVGGAVLLWDDDKAVESPQFKPQTKHDNNLPLQVKRQIKGGN